MVKEIEIINWDDSFAEGGDVTDSVKKDKGDDFIDAFHNATSYKVDEYIPPKEETPVEKKTDNRIISYKDFKMIKYEQTKPIVENLIYKNQLAIFGGETGAGKSFLALQTVMGVSAGIPLFDYFKTEKMDSLLFQFENENFDVKSRMENMEGNVTLQAGSEDWMGNCMVVPMNPEDEIFIDNWERMEVQMENFGFKDGLLIVDNMYTSTDKEIQTNHDCTQLLRIIDKIKKKFHISILLIAHINKLETGTKDLKVEQLQGGKTIANNVANIMQIHPSTASEDIKIAKITKGGRSGRNNLYNQPFKLNWCDKIMGFKKGVAIKNIATHFEEMKNKWEYELIVAVMDTHNFRASDYFDRDKFRDNLPEEYKDKDNPKYMYEKKIDRYLNKMCDYGLVEKFRRNDYMIRRQEIEDFVS